MTNTTYQLCPWADVLYAMDRAWWKRYIDDVRSTFKGELACPLSRCFSVPKVAFAHGENSGVGAIALAHHWGAQRIILLGYDVMATGGKRHWHGDHPKGLGNAGSMSKWPAQFGRLAKRLVGKVQVVNASRQTALKCWPRGTLEDLLCER